ncbi:MAG: hypothetical protein ACJAQT_003023 [Akkermansiaceae bacterium]|jgi:hypothetical protein
MERAFLIPKEIFLEAVSFPVSAELAAVVDLGKGAGHFSKEVWAFFGEFVFFEGIGGHRHHAWAIAGLGIRNEIWRETRHPHQFS